MKPLVYCAGSLLLGVALGVSIDEITTRPASNEAATVSSQIVETDEEFSERALEQARNMLAETFGTPVPFSGLSPGEVAKRLNYVVFNHCKNEQPHTGRVDINELFHECRAACGGYSYVLRGLLAVHGIPSRYANLYNVPQQGNHTLVEANVGPGQWMLLDPTFGSYFTKDGNPDGEALSLSGVRFELNLQTIGERVFVAQKGDPAEATKDLSHLYGQGRFSYPYMRVENYLLAEGYAPTGLGLTVPLVLPLRVVDGVAQAGTLEAATVAEGEQAFLSWTNATLNNDDLEDDTSYLFSIVGSHPPYFESLNIVHVDGLENNIEYELRVAGTSRNHSNEIQIVDIGRGVSMNSVLQEVTPAGPFTISRIFRSETGDARFAIRLIRSSGASVRIFGVSITSLKGDAQGARVGDAAI